MVPTTIKYRFYGAYGNGNVFWKDGDVRAVEEQLQSLGFERVGAGEQIIFFGTCNCCQGIDGIPGWTLHAEVPVLFICVSPFAFIRDNPRKSFKNSLVAPYAVEPQGEEERYVTAEQIAHASREMLGKWKYEAG